MKKFYDIIITGGGMVGSVLACKLAQNPALRSLSILLIENAPKKIWTDELVKQPNQFSNRVSALSPLTKDLLTNIGVWESISEISCRSVMDMKIWGCGSKNISTTFDTKESKNLGALSYIVENNILIAAGMKRLEEMNDRVDTLHNKQVIDCSLPKSLDNLVKIKFNDDTTVECRLLLGADGVRSKVREKMNIQYLSWNYKQQAVVATLKIIEEKGNHTAWQKFLTTGPIALLPLSEQYSSLVWTTTPEHAKQLTSLPHESFVDALNTALWQEPVKDIFVENIAKAVGSLMETFNLRQKNLAINIPTVTAVIDKSISSFPVGFGYAVNCVGDRVGLIGDAAHRVHPLAGQGVNLGFADVKYMDSVLTHNIECGAELGDVHYLRDYETEMQRNNVIKLVGIDLIQKIAGHTWSPLIALMNTGLQVADNVPSIKKYLIKTATS